MADFLETLRQGKLNSATFCLINCYLFLYIMIIPQYTERIALLVNYF